MQRVSWINYQHQVCISCATLIVAMISRKMDCIQHQRNAINQMYNRYWVSIPLWENSEVCYPEILRIQVRIFWWPQYPTKGYLGNLSIWWVNGQKKQKFPCMVLSPPPHATAESFPRTAPSLPRYATGKASDERNPTFSNKPPREDSGIRHSIFLGTQPGEKLLRNSTQSSLARYPRKASSVRYSVFFSTPSCPQQFCQKPDCSGHMSTLAYSTTYVSAYVVSMQLRSCKPLVCGCDYVHRQADHIHWKRQEHSDPYEICKREKFWYTPQYDTKTDKSWRNTPLRKGSFGITVLTMIIKAQSFLYKTRWHH